MINDNTLSKAGIYAGYTDWYCDHATNPNCTKVGPVCPSWNNQFRNNALDGSYACTTLGTFKYFQGASTAGRSPPSAGAKRLSTSGNQQTTKPCSL